MTILKYFDTSHMFKARKWHRHTTKPFKTYSNKMLLHGHLNSKMMAKHKYFHDQTTQHLHQILERQKRSLHFKLTNNMEESEHENTLPNSIPNPWSQQYLFRQVLLQCSHGSSSKYNVKSYVTCPSTEDFSLLKNPSHLSSYNVRLQDPL